MARQLKDHAVATHLAAELPLVPMDDLLVEQVLINLLENAVKYAPASTPIDVSARTSGDALVVEVADRGPGLPQADLERVFEKFYRAANSTGRSGAGLGLAICRGMIELQGGRIVAENRPGGGAIFRFTLPLASTQPALPVSESSASS